MNAIRGVSGLNAYCPMRVDSIPVTLFFQRFSAPDLRHPRKHQTDGIELSKPKPGKVNKHMPNNPRYY